MPIPFHDSDCKTSIYSTKCPDCNEDVYFFSCSCGSKVFFDLNFPPWNPHERRCWKYLIRILIEIYHFPESYIPTYIENFAIQKQLDIPEDVKEYLNKVRINPDIKLETNKIIVKEIVPYEGFIHLVGEIKSINQNINFFKKLKIENNEMGRLLLNKFVENSYHEIHIRTKNDVSNHFSDYHCYIKVSDFLKHKFKAGELVNIVLVCENILGISNIWLISEIDKF